jgi:putative OPT family oligopeptide transporter
MSEARGGSLEAHAPVHYEPYIADETALREFSWRGIVLGTLLGVVFGASSLYLVLKVGLTVSASIPVAVISITFFRLMTRFGWRDATILENNIVQTAGSAGESLAFGIGVTMPAVMILGFELELARVALVALLGGTLGILMMIPLRRALIVAQHGKLKFPEGTACAEVLKAGASPESRAAASSAAKAEEARGLGQSLSARTIFAGFGLGIAYKTVMVALKGWKDVPEKIFGAPFKGASVSAEISPELLGVGYIIGPRVAGIMCAGGVLAYMVFIPLIHLIGGALESPLAPGTIPIREMGPNQIRGAYVLYIGAGAVAAGGVISLSRAMPTIWSGLREGLRDLGPGKAQAGGRRRTERDLSMKVVLIGALALIAAITAAPWLDMNVLGAVMILVFGFLFVTVSSRLTGEIGSSSNPISGMTVATLILTCSVFLLIGWTGGRYYVTALSIGAIVCVAASNGGTTAQDLKTGFLVGATPRLQQIAIVIGAGVSALALGPILMRLNTTATVYVPIEQVVPAGYSIQPSQLEGPESLHGPQAALDSKAYRAFHKTDDVGAPPGKYLADESGRVVYLVDPGINGNYSVRPDGSEVRKFGAPQATLMSYIIKGILDRKLPWALVLLGVTLAVVLEMAGVPSLAFAVGVYLPLSSSTPILAGGLVRWFVDSASRRKLAHRKLSEEELAAESDRSPGVLMASGYIAGGAIAGILIAFVAGVLEELDTKLLVWSRNHNPLFAGAWSDLLSMVPFVLLMVLLYAVGREWLLGPPKDRTPA